MILPIAVTFAVLLAALPAAPSPVRLVAPHPGLDRRVGIAALLAVAGGIIDPALGLAVAVSWFGSDVLRRRRDAQARTAAVRRELPEVIDLLALALGGGGSIHAAVARVGARPLGPVSAAMQRATRRVADGDRLASALEEAARDLGPPVRPLVRALVGAEHYGTTVVATLDRLATEARAQRRRHAQQAARRAPVKLLFPLVLAVLPAFVLLTVVPTLAGTFDGLRSGP